MSSRSSQLVACLGGTPRFQPPLPLASPRIPRSVALLPKLQAILDSGHLTKGSELLGFEHDCCAYLGVKHSIGVSSCTLGLMLVYQALKRRHPLVLKPRLAVPSFTFMASIAAMRWAGFEPEFVEVDPDTMNLDLDDLATILAKDDVLGAVAVHCFGNPVPTRAIETIAHTHKKALIFDAAHAFGSYHDGVPVGRAGWCQVYSLTPTKMVIAGEGGLVVTNDPELDSELRIGREYGNDGHYNSTFAGLNARLPEMSCVLARASLTQLESVVQARNETAALLRQALTEVPGIGFQLITPNSRTTYKDFTIRIDPGTFGCSRDALAWALHHEGVPTRAYFSPPCHHHDAYRAFSSRPLPETDWLAKRCLSLPLLSPDTSGPLSQAITAIQEQAEKIDQAHAKSFSNA